MSEQVVVIVFCGVLVAAQIALLWIRSKAQKDDSVGESTQEGQGEP